MPSKDSHMAEPSRDEGRHTPASSIASLNGSPRTRPNCVRCRNHNVKTPLKGHKRYCDFRDCCCDKCLNTLDRQQTMAKQIAERRRNALDEERRLQGYPVPTSSPPPGESEDPDTPSSSSIGFNSSNSSTSNYPASSISCRPNSNSNLSVVSSSTNISVINRPGSASAHTTASTTSTIIPNNNHDNDNNNNSNIISSDNNNNNSYSVTSEKSPEPVRLQSVIYLMDILGYHQLLDVQSLLYVILKAVNSDVKEAYRRIVEGQEEMRPLRALLDYPPPLQCSPLRLPIPLLPPPLHQAAYRFHPYLKTSAAVTPSYAFQIPRPSDMFQCGCIPKPDFKSDVPVNLHNDKTYTSSLEV